MSFFVDVFKIIIDKFLTSDFVFHYKAKSLKNGIEYGDYKDRGFCKKELSYLTKERLAKTKNREMANYFIGLSEHLNHSISADHFKKFYPYLIIKEGKAELEQSMLKKLENTNTSFKLLGFLFIVIFVILSGLAAYQNSYFLIPVFGICMLFFLGLFLSQVIQKYELNDFKEKIEKYNNQL